MEPEIKYIELKSGQGDCGPAWIARVQKSKSGRTIYFNGMALKSCGGSGIGGNYFDAATGSEYIGADERADLEVEAQLYPPDDLGLYPTEEKHT